MNHVPSENERLEIKDVTRGFLHDMNNLFTIVLASISAAKGYEAVPDEAMKHLDDAIAATFKSTELASMLMRIWNNLQLPKELISAEEIVNDAVATVQNTVSSEIFMHSGSLVSEKFLFVNRISMVNVLIGLILNADGAIKDNGKTGLISIEYKMIDRMLEMTIDDNACALTRMETEFYKKFISHDKGMHGVGLSMIEAIVSQHYGYFRMEKNEIGGMSAIVGLPVIAIK